MDIILRILQLIAYILLLVILALLWRRAFRQSESRDYWRLLAWAWTLNLLGSLAWIVHDLVTGTTLNTFSVVDFFYVSQYVLVGCALWLYPTSLPGRAWFWIVGAMLVANVVIWTVYYNPAVTLRGEGWISFLGLAAYPALDAGIVTLAWLRVRAARQSAWSWYAFLLFCVMAMYGVANTINLSESVFWPQSDRVLANVFWILSNVFLLVMVVGADLQAGGKSWMRNEG